MIWRNCPITNTTSTISKLFSLKEDNIHTGYDIITRNVYSACNGVVIFIGKEAKYNVCVQYSPEIVLNYSNLDILDVKPNQILTKGDKIGTCLQHVHFEYLTKDYSICCVRIGSQSYYANDPSAMFDESNKIYDPGMRNLSIYSQTDFSKVKLTEEMKKEFEDNI